MPRTEAQVDHGLPDMTYIEAYKARASVTPLVSALGLIEAANRAVFHKRGFALTWNPRTGDLWLTPTADPEGWSYAVDSDPLPPNDPPAPPAGREPDLLEGR